MVKLLREAASRTIEEKAFWEQFNLIVMRSNKDNMNEV